MPMGKKRKNTDVDANLAADSILFRPRPLQGPSETSPPPSRALQIQKLKFSFSTLHSFAFAVWYTKINHPQLFNSSTSFPPPRLLDHPPPFLVLLPDPAADEKLLFPDRDHGLELVDGPGDRLLVEVIVAFSI